MHEPGRAERASARLRRGGRAQQRPPGLERGKVKQRWQQEALARGQSSAWPGLGRVVSEAFLQTRGAGSNGRTWGAVCSPSLR